MTKENLFLDYGGLIFNYNFNRHTLFRAHNIALKYINSISENPMELNRLAKAHDSAINEYLTARQDNSEWGMDKIMGLMLNKLDSPSPIPVSMISLIYKLNDHDASPKGDAVEILKDLAKEKRIGIITNLPHDSFIYELQKFELLNLISTITPSYQVGFRKPHPAIYLEAMKKANAIPKNSIFASHDKIEVEGAEAVGMEGILADSLEEMIGELYENNLYQY